ncbi:hypothetical protein [Parapedobacter sp. DT-150]|uniref:hypothetical protein n=1 Tax=Parapedobacter sp. DT-150 TaxID=3396162 RepID=UPI003F1D8104
MRSTIIITSVLFIAVVVASFFYFSDLKEGNSSKRKALTHVPGDAAFLLSFTNDTLVDDLFAQFDLFHAVLGHEGIQQLNYVQDTILRQEQLAPYIAGQEVFFSFHAGENRLDYLIALATNERLAVDELFEAIQDIDSNVTVQWADSSRHIFSLQPTDQAPPLYVMEQQGVLLASFSRQLISRAIDDNTPKLPSDATAHFRSVADDEAPLTWYIRHDQLFDLAEDLMRREPGDFAQLLQGFTGYSTLRMNFKNDAFIFSGGSTLATDSAAYLSLYRQQRPVEQTLATVFPVSTASYLWFGITDYKSLHNNLVELFTDRQEIGQINEQHRLIRQSSTVSIAADLLPEWDDEFAVVELANRENVAVIKVKDSRSFSSVIQRISTRYPENMHRLNHSNLLYYSFGDPLKPFTRPYFLLIDAYMICANHASTLRQFEAAYSTGKTLASTIGYINFNALQANKANVSLFVHNENAGNTIARGLKPPFETAYMDTTNFGYQRFYGWSVQLSGNSEGFFTNVYAAYPDNRTPVSAPQETATQETTVQETATPISEWTFTLNGQLITKPVVCQYNDTANYILVQDRSHILHAVSVDGRKLWNAQLPGPILGSVQQLADRTLVFTTADRLYRIDNEGDPLPGFSLQLPLKATEGAITSDEKEEIHITVPVKNRILSYDGRGRSLRSKTHNTAAERIRQQDTVQDLNSANPPVDLPSDCGPLFYMGPLRGNNPTYLLCSKNDGRLHCYRYD